MLLFVPIRALREWWRVLVRRRASWEHTSHLECHLSLLSTLHVAPSGGGPLGRRRSDLGLQPFVLEPLASSPCECHDMRNPSAQTLEFGRIEQRL